MKINQIKLFFALLFALCLTFGLSSCSKKTGCPINEEAHVKTGKDGSYKPGKTHSGLFPDKVKKKKKKNR